MGKIIQNEIQSIVKDLSFLLPITIITFLISIFGLIDESLRKSSDIYLAIWAVSIAVCVFSTSGLFTKITQIRELKKASKSLK